MSDKPLSAPEYKHCAECGGYQEQHEKDCKDATIAKLQAERDANKDKCLRAMRDAANAYEKLQDTKEQRDKLQAHVKHEKDFRIRSMNESAIREQELKAELAEAKQWQKDAGPKIWDLQEKIISKDDQIAALREALLEVWNIPKPWMTGKGLISYPEWETACLKIEAVLAADPGKPTGFHPTTSTYTVTSCQKCGKPKPSAYIRQADECECQPKETRQ